MSFQSSSLCSAPPSHATFLSPCNLLPFRSWATSPAATIARHRSSLTVTPSRVCALCCRRPIAASARRYAGLSPTLQNLRIRYRMC
ncbi:unnamed protein product [Chondrus crispus]|uniref:Uncharacterized protein n=1 Tax=Chondrus crispus TaxID=2769 RepID=R7QN87_CHOCR|nr:unnamed protein product [Chondrus crispus]CDF39248.1 unnamed protein product [Chondrus crispus]|eukprot:XP_005719159.1 unnamed protein product [Chondrus crispus]